MDADQIEGPGSGRGKWAETNVPHRGWTCVDVLDLDEPSQVCDMCEAMTIRYVHVMTHPDHPDPLECGCICAGHMEGDLTAARGRERLMKNNAARRKRWPDRTGWKLSRNGNPTIRADGNLVTVYRKGQGWGAMVLKISTDQKVHARRTYRTSRAAQIAAFDRMIVGFPDPKSERHEK
jgi:hypothetical protein